MTGPLLTIGADPGASGGLALCRCVSGQKPELLEAYWLRGATDSAYFQAAFTACLKLQAIAGRRVDIVWIEEVPPFGRAGTAAGLARRQGMILAALSMISAPDATRVLPNEWWAVWGDHIQRGKNEADGGFHRFTEAMALLNGRSHELASGPVDMAEAALIAGAAGLHRLGEGFVRTPAPKKPRAKKGAP